MRLLDETAEGNSAAAAERGEALEGVSRVRSAVGGGGVSGYRATSATARMAATTASSASGRLPVRIRNGCGTSQAGRRENGHHRETPDGVQASASTWAQ